MRERYSHYNQTNDQLSFKFATHTNDYNQIVSKIINDKKSSSLKHCPPPFSWLTPIQINSHKSKDATFKKSILRTKEKHSEGEEEDYDCENNNNDNKIRRIPKNEILLLQMKLNELKRKLWPAAMERATAINSQHHHQSTPSYEFRKAREACNPFEGLGDTTTEATKNMKKRGNGRYKKQQQNFVCRSAMKLANIDALLNFPFTTVTSYASNNSSSSFVFVDLCGAPGGFSEYLLHNYEQGTVNFLSKEDAEDNNLHIDKSSPTSSNMSFSETTTNNKISCRGYGMSLINKNEHGSGLPWKLKQSSRLKNIHCRNNNNVTYRICTGCDKTGDIYNWKNVLSLQNEIQMDLDFHRRQEYEREKIHSSSTSSADDSNNTLTSKLSCNNAYSEQQGNKKERVQGSRGGIVNLVLADGGFDLQRNSENQEVQTQQIIINQVAAALFLLKQQRQDQDGSGGTFLIKMFGFQTKCIRKIMKCLYESFERICIIKPVTSRPASAERYVICLSYKGISNTMLSLSSSCNKDFDALNWRDNMLKIAADENNKTITTSSNETNNQGGEMGSEDDTNLYNYLDVMDKNMLYLNMKACFQIISFLENNDKYEKRRFTIEGEGNKMTAMHYEEGYGSSTQQQLNFSVYNNYWKI